MSKNESWHLWITLAALSLLAASCLPQQAGPTATPAAVSPAVSGVAATATSLPPAPMPTSPFPPTPTVFPDLLQRVAGEFLSAPEGLVMNVFQMARNPFPDEGYEPVIRSSGARSLLRTLTQGRYYWDTADLALMEADNSALAPFGYRLASKPVGPDTGARWFTLYQGDKVILDPITSLGGVSVNRSGTDFLLLVEAGKLQLVRNGSLEDWKFSGSTIFNASPQFLGDDIMHVEIYEETPEAGTKTPEPPPVTAKVFRNDEIIFTRHFQNPIAASGYRGFWTYQDHWALETVDHVVIDGQDVNALNGYDKSYEFHLLNGKPLFFFEKAGKLGLSFDNKTAFLPFTSIPHYGCCSAGEENPKQIGNILILYGVQGESWFYVELASNPLITASPVPTSLPEPQLTDEQVLAKAVLNKEQNVYCNWIILGYGTDKIYAWVRCDLQVEPFSAGSVPAVIHLAPDGRYTSVEIPGDGTQYPVDVRRLFPAGIQAMIFGHNLSFDWDWALKLRQRGEIKAPYVELAFPMDVPGCTWKKEPLEDTPASIAPDTNGWKVITEVEAGFSLSIPPDWSAGQMLWQCTNQAPVPHFLYLTSPDNHYQLGVGFRRPDQPVYITRTGTPAGDFVADEPAKFFGKELSAQRLVYQGNDMAVFYNGAAPLAANGTLFTLSLDINDPWSVPGLPADVEDQARLILGSFQRYPSKNPSPTLTGTIYANAKNGESYQPSISEDGRFIVFSSQAKDLVNETLPICPTPDGQGIPCAQTYLYDRQAGRLELISRSRDGSPANGLTSGKISGDGQKILFISWATNLAPPWQPGLYLLDRGVKSIKFIGPYPDGHPALSGDGRKVVFGKLNPAMTFVDVYLYDDLTGATQNISSAGIGKSADGSSLLPAISADGQWVAFWSWSDQIVPEGSDYEFCAAKGPNASCGDVYVKNLPSGKVDRIPVGEEWGEGMTWYPISLADDGQWLAFRGSIYDRQLGQPFLQYCMPHITCAGGQISGDGKWVVYAKARDIFIQNRSGASSERVSVSSAGVPGNGSPNDITACADAPGCSRYPSFDVSQDGRWVVFDSTASNLVPGDDRTCDDGVNVPHNCQDIFLRDRETGTTEWISKPQ